MPKSQIMKITINLRTRDVSRARELAKTQAIPYQHVIRRWVAEGAERKTSTR